MSFITGMMTNPNRIKRRKLSDAVQERLLEIIQDGALRPGDVLPSERELMATFEVGRPAIREAMQDLQRMGLVEIRHGGRPKVAEPSPDSMVDQLSQTMRHLLAFSEDTMRNLKEARLLFEVEMARIAARKRSANDLMLLRKVIKEQNAARDDSEAFMLCDREFHRVLASISGNPIFEALARSVFDWLAHFKVEMVRQEGLEQLTTTEHRAIVDAIENQDENAAAKAMSDHLTRANALYREP